MRWEGSFCALFTHTATLSPPHFLMHCRWNTLRTPGAATHPGAAQYTAGAFPLLRVPWQKYRHPKGSTWSGRELVLEVAILKQN